MRPRLMSQAREDSFRSRLVARDERALSELVDLASPWLLGLVQGMLHDQDEAEEVVIEAFRVAWERIDASPRGGAAAGAVADGDRPQPGDRPAPVAQAPPSAR